MVTLFNHSRYQRGTFYKSWIRGGALFTSSQRCYKATCQPYCLTGSHNQTGHLVSSYLSVSTLSWGAKDLGGGMCWCWNNAQPWMLLRPRFHSHQGTAEYNTLGWMQAMEGTHWESTWYLQVQEQYTSPRSVFQEFLLQAVWPPRGQFATWSGHSGDAQCVGCPGNPTRLSHLWKKSVYDDLNSEPNSALQAIKSLFKMWF